MLAVLVAIGAAALYVATLAPGTLFGDPSEYQFIPAIWGIAHPPGYAFYTLLAGLWQRLVVVGSVAYRTNLLAAGAGAWIATRVVLITLDVGIESGSSLRFEWVAFAAVLAGLGVAVAPDLWQHSIHANAHVVSAAITITQLWMLVRWDHEMGTRWLLVLAFLVGIGVVHHPITVWGVPAYLLYILIRHPQILTELRTILGGVAATALGMLPWLYFPLRSPSTPFGPLDMATWDGFLRHATAQGLRVNLFHFGLADQPNRLRVFVTLLQLQYGWVLIGLILLGALHLVLTRPGFALLWGGFLLGHLVFTLNSVQDVMAYLLHAFVALGLPLGLGFLTALEWFGPRRRWERLLVAGLLAGLVAARGVFTFPRISLRDWQAADDFVAELQATFDGRGLGAAFVSDWEHLTPYFYHTYVGDLQLRDADFRPVYVTAATPWVESVYAHLSLGPVFLSNYRPDVRALGFRLRPQGNLWAVLEPPATTPVAPQQQLEHVWVDGRLQLLGYDLPTTAVTQGEIVPLTLYGRLMVTETEILMPFARLGQIEQRWTTDSRRLTPYWQPGEIIVERYPIFVPYGLPPGDYPLTLGYTQMTGATGELDINGASTLLLDVLEVTPVGDGARIAQRVAQSVTNLGNEVALRSVRARAGLTVREGRWERPLSVRAGTPLHLRLVWEVLAPPTTSYTVFIHLVDAQGALRFGHDYTPLGGAFPAYLWFPKWLVGQRVVAPYRLVLPADLPPGDYSLQVGMYEMGSIRRVPQLSPDGTLIGDRTILGPLEVVAP